MTESRVRIECIKVKDLYDFACKSIDSRKPGESVPISKSRAKAWSNNPHAAEDDITLIVGYQNGRCVGHLGLMPGRLRTTEGFNTVFWASAWYVPPQFRHTGVGAMLMMRALTLRRDIVVTGFSEQASRVYERLRFKPLGPLTYLEANFNQFDLLSLPFRALRKLVSKLDMRSVGLLDRLIDGVRKAYKKPLYLILMAETGRSRRKIRTVQVDQITDRSFEIEKTETAPVRFFRGAEVINWMLKDPWVVTDPQQSTSGFYFRDCQPEFRYIALKVFGREDGQYIGFVILRANKKRTNRVVTVYDYHFHDPADRHYLLGLVVGQGNSILADKIVLPNVCYQNVRSSWLMRRLFREAERAYFYFPGGPDSPLGRDINQLKLDLSDSDLPFA